MKKVFMTQRVAAILFILMSAVIFVYALAFMTDYENLFGLILPANQNVALFHDRILQSFNQGILVWAIVGMAGVACTFIMETLTKVPDRFALIFMAVMLGACVYGSIYALQNLPAIMSYYRTMDISSIHLEGIQDYTLKFTTFYIGIGLYAAQLVVCVLYLAGLAASHITFVKLRKRGEVE